MEIIKAIGMAEMRKRKRRVFVEQSEKAIVVEMEQSGLPGLLILSCEWGDRSERWAKGRDEIGTAWWLDFCTEIWSHKLVTSMYVTFLIG